MPEDARRATTWMPRPCVILPSPSCDRHHPVNYEGNAVNRRWRRASFILNRGSRSADNKYHGRSFATQEHSFCRHKGVSGGDQDFVAGIFPIARLAEWRRAAREASCLSANEPYVPRRLG